VKFDSQKKYLTWKLFKVLEAIKQVISIELESDSLLLLNIINSAQTA